MRQKCKQVCYIKIILVRKYIWIETMYTNLSAHYFSRTAYLVPMRAAIQDTSRSRHRVLVIPPQCCLDVLHQSVFGAMIHTDTTWNT